jgi:methylglyoxal synthase
VRASVIRDKVEARRLADQHYKCTHPYNLQATEGTGMKFIEKTGLNITMRKGLSPIACIVASVGSQKCVQILIQEGKSRYDY